MPALPGGIADVPPLGGETMSMTDHAPDIAHRFDSCDDPDCTDVLCSHYRAGLAAGHEFMQGSKARLGSVRPAVRGADGGTQEP